jgi:hypothetical protein
VENFLHNKIKIGIAAVVLAVFLSDLIWNLHGYTPRPDGVDEGVRQLQSLDAQSVAEADSMIAAIARQKQIEEGERIKEAVLSGESDPFTLFTNYAICGDSRTEALKAYGLLEERRVVADVGWDLNTLSAHVSEIQALNPLNIFLEVGLNDVNNGDALDMDSFISRFSDCCRTIQAAVPDAVLYVNSIFPVRADVLDQKPYLADIPVVNERLAQMCGDNGWVWIDNGAIVEQHADLYENDGIHFNREFNTYWAQNMIIAQIDHDTGAGASDEGQS